MSTFKVNVSPDVLIWARRTSGFSWQDAAEKIKVSETELRMWEEGADDPTLAQLRELARIYRYPLAVMLLAQPPTGIEVPRDFRLLPENQGREWTPSFRREFRRLQYQQQVVRDLASTTGDTPPPLDIRVSFDDSPESVAERIRSWLIDVGGDSRSRLDQLDLSKWIALIEGRGILVTQIEGVSLDEMRGCSISNRPFPIIALNGKDSAAGKLFTVFHELAHVLLNEQALCDFGDHRTANPTEAQQVERFCNQVSAATLMPASLLLANPAVHGADRLTNWSNDELFQIASSFSVSAEALLLRLVSLGKASSDLYWKRRPYFVEHYKALNARREAELQESEGGPNTYSLKIRNLGRMYISDVLEAYEMDLIDLSDVSDYLNIKINNLPKLMNRMSL